MRLTKIYTRTGDQGETLLGKSRISKSHPLVDMVGELDELNSSIGMVIALSKTHQAVTQSLTLIQHQLFDMGGELHSGQAVISHHDVTQLEEAINQWNTTLPPLKEFLLPGGSPASAACHLARTICRRAERTMTQLRLDEMIANLALLPYLNRLSDFLFVTARVIALGDNQPETIWEQRKK